MLCTIEVSNSDELIRWLDAIVGPMAHRYRSAAYGDGWSVYLMWDGHWRVQLDDDRLTTLFLLRWS